MRVASVEGNVLVAGALVDGEGNEGGRHLLLLDPVVESRISEEDHTFGVSV